MPLLTARGFPAPTVGIVLVMDGAVVGLHLPDQTCDFIADATPIGGVGRQSVAVYIELGDAEEIVAVILVI